MTKKEKELFTTLTDLVDRFGLAHPDSFSTGSQWWPVELEKAKEVLK